MKAVRVRVGIFYASMLFACAAFTVVAPLSHAVSAAPATVEEKVVYHVDDMAAARSALINIANHLTASPQAKISLVANGKGIYMLSQGEGDRVGEYATTIADLRARGVHIVACHNSMTVFGIAPAKLVAGAQIVPAGVVELVRLQNAEHYAYIKP